jgi:UDP-N-acetylglucosamine 1-carboxyvinyltransferase
VGDVEVRGSKNAVTKHMVAAILADGESTIKNIPEVGDVAITAEILESLGCEVHIESHVATIAPNNLGDPSVPLRFSGLNRIPILLLGPLLHRLGEAFVPLVGGDSIGSRPVDFHVDSLRAMGAEVTVAEDGITAKATALNGAHIALPYPSVGATETVLLTAVLAKGRTVLENAAIEPEVIELALFLQRMGARIEMRPGRKYIIEGVDSLQAATHRLAGDRIEAFSYLAAGLITGGRVRVFGCHQDRLVTAISTLSRIGARFDITDEWVAAEPQGLHSAAVETGTHPGFMTDWQSPLVALFTQAHGLSVLHETVYEERFPYVPALNQMGAEIEVFDTCLGGPGCRFANRSVGHSAIVRGPSKLHGAEIVVPDIRGGFAYVLAAAAAEGDSLIKGVHHLDRGYNRPLDNFAQLGLDIERVPPIS